MKKIIFITVMYAMCFISHAQERKVSALETNVSVRKTNASNPETNVSTPETIVKMPESVASIPERVVPEVKADETIVFEKTEHDFGVVAENGGDIAYEFTFKNEGHAPLVVTRVNSSCGCTVPDWTKEPVAPGKTGFIKVTFNPKSRKGVFTKSVTVFSNGNPANKNLSFKGEVK